MRKYLYAADIFLLDRVVQPVVSRLHERITCFALARSLLIGNVVLCLMGSLLSGLPLWSTAVLLVLNIGVMLILGRSIRKAERECARGFANWLRVGWRPLRVLEVSMNIVLIGSAMLGPITEHTVLLRSATVLVAISTYVASCSPTAAKRKEFVPMNMAFAQKSV